MKTYDLLDIAFIAGFWQGEGTIGCYKIKKKINKGKKKIIHKLFVHISQKDRTCLDKIKKVLGFGWISTFRPKNNSFSGKGPYYSWSCSSKSALIFINLIRSYITSNYKKRQIKRALRLAKKFVVPHLRGVNSENSKFSKTQINNIRKYYSQTDMSLQDLSDMYHVNKTTIGRIVKFKTYVKENHEKTKT